MEKATPAEAEEIRRSPIRTLANAFVNTCWRNGPIEDFHAGQADRVRLRERRFTTDEAALLLRDTTARFTDALEAFWIIEPHWGTHRFIEHALVYGLAPFVGPVGWTTHEDNRAIDLHADEIQT